MDKCLHPMKYHLCYKIKKGFGATRCDNVFTICLFFRWKTFDLICVYLDRKLLHVGYTSYIYFKS